jgi:hypothetical protein
LCGTPAREVERKRGGGLSTRALLLILIGLVAVWFIVDGASRIRG